VRSGPERSSVQPPLESTTYIEWLPARRLQVIRDEDVALCVGPDILGMSNVVSCARMTRYWINTVSRDHIRAGVEGGFTQANHGRATTLRQLARDDLVAFYSPRTRYPDGEPLQHFTAIGRVIDDAPYQAEMNPTFHPWRRRLQFLECEEAPMQDLIGDLTLTRDRKHWGLVFRRGLFQVGAEDFQRIAHAMNVRIQDS